MKNRIKELRIARGLSSKKLAEAAGIDNSMLNRLETGKRRLNVEMMQRIAHALDVKPAELITEVPASSLSTKDRELVVEIFESLSAAYAIQHKKNGASSAPPKQFSEILKEAFAQMEDITAKTQNMTEIRELVKNVCQKISNQD